ncbi:unnamed protein product [Fraxinus pennsylvanica]|uniref:Uncharacterized protein n=1 Tax=Fraxinus pennsylvanica TaxID=56036 RepID=A0AAD2DUN6_9LAMI|nr:unnamed protein product [Fraxinus pennsylvanica]
MAKIINNGHTDNIKSPAGGRGVDGEAAGYCREEGNAGQAEEVAVEAPVEFHPKVCCSLALMRVTENSQQCSKGSSLITSCVTNQSLEDMSDFQFSLVFHLLLGFLNNTTWKISPQSLKLKSKTTNFSEKTNLGEILYLTALWDKFKRVNPRRPEIQAVIPPTIELFAKLSTDIDSAADKKQGKLLDNQFDSRLRYTKA